MNTMRAWVAAVALLGAAAALAAGPQQNLQVELRWVESSLSGAALAGVRDGAVVVGTAGSVSPKGGGTTLSTRRPDAGVEPAQRLLVLNGHAATVMLTEPQKLEWFDIAQPVAPGGAPAGRPLAVQRTRWVERQRGFTARVDWPGGSRPAKVELKTLTPEAHAGQGELVATVELPLDRWVTIARSGADARRPERGVTSSGDAEQKTSRELQLRVNIAP